MSEQLHEAERREPGRRPPLWVVLLVLGCLILFVAANAHLVHVAVQSQPVCVLHAQASGGETHNYRAAKPAC